MYLKVKTHLYFVDPNKSKHYAFYNFKFINPQTVKLVYVSCNSQMFMQNCTLAKYLITQNWEGQAYVKVGCFCLRWMQGCDALKKNQERKIEI